MSEEGSGNSKFVVRDRRRFDSEGNDRADGSSERSSSAASAGSSSPGASPIASQGASKAVASSAVASSTVASSTAASTTVASTPKPDKSTQARPDMGPPPDTEINFSQFVISLATQALMQLGEIQPPDGMPIEVDRDGARQTIDILSVIDYKTRGNLTEEEAKLMEEVLHRLRLSYVKHMKSA